MDYLLQEPAFNTTTDTHNNEEENKWWKHRLIKIFIILLLLQIREKMCPPLTRTFGEWSRSQWQYTGESMVMDSLW